MKNFRVKGEDVYRFSVDMTPVDGDEVLQDILGDIIDEIRERTELDVREVDRGIGHYEIHGQRGVDVDYQPELNRLTPDSVVIFQASHDATAQVMADVVVSIINDTFHDSGVMDVDVEEHGATCEEDRSVYPVRCRMAPTVSTWEEGPRTLGVLIETAWELE